MTGDQWLAVMIAIAVALLLILLLLIAAVVIRRPKAQLAAAYQRFSSSDALPDRNRRCGEDCWFSRRSSSLTRSGWPSCCPARRVSWRESQPPLKARSPAACRRVPVRHQPPTPGTVHRRRRPFNWRRVADSAKPFQAVRIQGTYHGGADRFLRVQRWEGGKWLAFPIPTKTDQSGYFATYVEFGKPGRYSLRVWDPDSNMTSKPFVLVIRG